MVEEIGLGQAIAGGTNLSGGWNDAPLTRGLQLDSQNEFRRLEQEKAKQAALEKKQEEMRKLSTFDYDKWANKEVAKKFEDYASKRLPEMQEKFSRGDKMGAYKVRTEIENEMRTLKRLDRDTAALKNLPKNSAIKGSIENDFSQGGIFKILEEDSQFNFLPKRIDIIDEETGEFRVNDTENPNIDRLMGQKSQSILSSLPKSKAIGKEGNAIVYSVDEKDPNYIKEKEALISSIMIDPANLNLARQIAKSDDFRYYYKDYLKNKGVGANEDTEFDFENAMKSFLEYKFENNKISKVSKQTPRSGGGSTDKNKFRFTVNADGATAVAYGDGRTNAYATFAGDELVSKKGSNEVQRIKSTTKYEAPIITYLGNGKFKIEGSVMEKGKLVPAEFPMEVDKNELMFKLGLDEAKLKANFPAYAKEQGGVQKPKSGVTTKKKQYKGLDVNGNPIYE
jgi:hypothetical protein